MAVVFLEGGLSPYQFKWRAPNSIVGPVAGYVNLHCRAPITKRNSLLSLAFRMARHRPIEISPKTTIKK